MEPSDLYSLLPMWKISSFIAVFCTSDLQIMYFTRTSFFSCPPRCLFSYDSSYAVSSVRSSALKSQRFLEMASFSVIIASSDSIWSKERTCYGALMLSLMFLPNLNFVTFQVENVTLYLANSQESVLGIQTVKTPWSQWNLCGSHKCRKARAPVLGEMFPLGSCFLTVWAFRTYSLNWKKKKKRQVSCKSILCTTELCSLLSYLNYLEIPLPSGNTDFPVNYKDTRN